MKIIGLTGGIASGKSTASSLLKKFGATIIDADVLARKVVKKGEPALEEIVSTFGKGILKQDGTLDRKVLGEVVFNNKKKLEKLNGIVHPAIYSLARASFEREKNKGAEKIVYDCPLLIEENLMYLVEEVWLIYVDEDEQLKRLMKRDGFTREQAMKRIQSQMPLQDKKKFADVVIHNNGSTKELEQRLKEYWYGK